MTGVQYARRRPASGQAQEIRWAWPSYLLCSFINIVTYSVWIKQEQSYCSASLREPGDLTLAAPVPFPAPHSSSPRATTTPKSRRARVQLRPPPSHAYNLRPRLDRDPIPIRCILLFLAGQQSWSYSTKQYNRDGDCLGLRCVPTSTTFYLRIKGWSIKLILEFEIANCLILYIYGLYLIKTCPDTITKKKLHYPMEA